MTTQATQTSFEDMSTDTHNLSSVAMIAEALTLADSGNAAVLGCGRCTEIPIRLLNEKFDRVDLIDLDGDALSVVNEQCRQWNDEKNVYQFHCADLTGLIETVKRRAGKLVADAIDPVECLEQLGELLESTVPEFWVPPHKQRYDLLICATVLTQLQALVRESVEKVYFERYSEHAPALLKHRPWCESVWRFARNLEESFFEHLGALVKPQGIVYLSATVHVSWLTQRDQRSVSAEGRWIATRTSRLADYLRPNNSIIEERHWNWLREGREGDFWGRLYGIQAIIYRIS